MAEFAKLFGKGVTWSYRQVYAGKVKPVTEFGRMLIPAAEVDRILATAGIYDGAKPKPAKTKAELERLAPKLVGAWEDYLAARRAKVVSGGQEIVAALRAGRGRKSKPRESAIKKIAKSRG